MEGPSQGQRQNYGSDEVYGIRRSSDMRRKSADRERYDSDPRVLGDDFTALELRDDEGEHFAQRCLSNTCTDILSSYFGTSAIAPPSRES